jgi:transmembrane sensor
MMNPNMTIAKPNTIQQQASYWVTRLHSDDCSDAESYAFDEWLIENENHRIAYQQVLAFWQQLADIEPHANTELEAARAYLRDKRQARRQFSGKRATTVLSLLLVISASPFFWSWLHTQNYQTAKGEQANIELSDGSQIELNTDTELSVHYTDNARNVKLHHGEALFTVVHNSTKPFAVTAANGVIKDIGTRFNVYQQVAKVSVTVLEGEVSVTTDNNATPRNVKPNQQLSYDNNGQLTPVTQADVNNTTAWQKKQLVFKAQPLSIVIEQLARYHDVSLQIADPRLQALKVSGSFPSDDLQVVLNTIANALPIKITSTGTTAFVIQAAD